MLDYVWLRALHVYESSDSIDSDQLIRPDALKLLISILPTLTPDQQVAGSKSNIVSLRGKGAVVRARVGELPVRQYISLLERGYRVVFGTDGDEFCLGASSRRLDAASGTCAARIRW